MIAMREFGIGEDSIVLDKQSGKDFGRSGYQRLVRKLNAGDTLVIKSIDQLGRNCDEILEQRRLLTEGKQAVIVALDMPRLDTCLGQSRLHRAEIQRSVRELRGRHDAGGKISGGAATRELGVAHGTF